MKKVKDFPPNIDEIRAKFRFSPSTVFTYGNTIYIPSGHLEISDDLEVHEQTHSDQQKKMGVKKWWKRYLDDPEFRIEQEVEAYRNQYQAAKKVSRQYHRGLLARISKDLAGPMYGHVMDRDSAKAAISGDN